ncbi:hypothetical protein HYALB_00004323 [Hymenoscyphus albidus]|uniref:Myotubularin phosphatase domain-containing protein n=1 Tax=Hymenoscyphus albidus TaxID=595503 RepID=A0A9N9QDG8_9HELO|nr:hypothetical protein HYALB_00004323 [Hymenoscyphus albidus]
MSSDNLKIAKTGSSEYPDFRGLKQLIQVDGVKFLATGDTRVATLHLTAHHLVLVEDPAHLRPATPPKRPTRPIEIWMPCASIASCTFRPTPPASGHQSSIKLRTRDFKFLTLNFPEDRLAREAYESLRNCTCKLGSIDKLYAFIYKSPPQEKEINGWQLYDPKAEFRRQGISEKGADKGWRISKLNSDYNFSPTYPAVLAVPTTISDNVLNYAAKYRSRERIPALTYLHPVNNCAITRSSQPRAGRVGKNRSIQDEKLVSACFSATASTSLLEKDATLSAPISRASPASSQVELDLPIQSGEIPETALLEDEIISAASNIEVEKPHVYGAQQNNMIVDARPRINATAMQVAQGLGSENMEYYNFATKVFLGIANIHVMRKSLNDVVEAIKDSDISKLPPNRDLLASSGWLKHINGLLDGSALIARQVGILHSSVLIHCSDGWDRTSQLSALAQLMLDPYYRTIEGFIVLVEKDFLSFGHMFQLRSGFLNSEKWFKSQNDALAGSAMPPVGSGNGGGDALEKGLLAASFATKRFFNNISNPNPSSDAVDSEPEDLVLADTLSSSKIDGTSKKEATDSSNISPVFHQFLDATYQLLLQHPTRFEFNERFLRRLLYHLYSCQYGTFLYNNEKSRLDARVQERTNSVWGYFLAQKPGFTNDRYDGGEIDDRVKGKERLIFPYPDKVRWWHGVLNRTDEEMNGLPVSNAAAEKYLGGEIRPGRVARSPSPGQPGVGVLTGVETAHAALTVNRSPSPKRTPQVSPVHPNGAGDAGSSTPTPIGLANSFATLRNGIAGLGIGSAMSGASGNGSSGSNGSPANGAGKHQPMEVEMQ